MFNLLIVDDEKWIRKGIIKKIQQLGFGFAHLGEAANGEEALALLPVEQPQIIITDIRMPIMDGIQLIKKVREADPDVRMIILSGFAEFEYAEKAMDMGVSGYLLKPVDDEKLAQVLRKAIADLEQRMAVQRIAGENRILDREKSALVVERWINQVFHAQGDAAAILKQEIPLPELADPTNWYLLALLDLGATDPARPEPGSASEPGDAEEIKAAAGRILERVLAGVPFFY